MTSTYDSNKIEAISKEVVVKKKKTKTKVRIKDKLRAIGNV